jgi:asparagine synthase (glutamine-hydrolysing)
VEIARNLSSNFGRINCPLTGGKDSRLLAAILINAGIPASYWTSGVPSSTDVIIGTQIAKAFKLQHKASTNLPEDYGIDEPPNDENVHDNWDGLARRMVLQNDGLVSLYSVADILGQPSTIGHLGVTLDGIGGGIAKSHYGSPDQFLSKPTAQTMVDQFPRDLIGEGYGKLIEPEAQKLAQAYVRRFLEECLDEGFAPLDLPDVFFAEERVRRWAGNCGRETLPIEDCFRFLCTRPFVEAAFSVPAIHRYCQPFHYELTKYLSLKLWKMPIDHPWRSQRPAVILGKAAVSAWFKKAWARMPGCRLRGRLERAFAKPRPSQTHGEIYDQAGWLEAKREEVREVCLGQEDSLIWSFVNRSFFDQLMSAQTDAKEREACHELLYAIATICYYEMAERSAAGCANPGADQRRHCGGRTEAAHGR